MSRSRRGHISKPIKTFILDDLELTPKSSQQLCKGSLLQQPDDKRFPLLVPLSVPRGKLCDLIGLLALGPRLEGRGFSRDHRADLSALGARAGTAIHIIELNDKKELSLRKRLRA